MGGATGRGNAGFGGGPGSRHVECCREGQQPGTCWARPHASGARRMHVCMQAGKAEDPTLKEKPAAAAKKGKKK